MIPVDQIMPAQAQSALIAVFGILVLGAAAHALVLLYRQADNRLLIMLGCGAAASLLEGFACHLIHCWHSAVGMVEVYEAFQIHVPLWLALLYILFFGAMPYYFLKSFARRRSAAFFWGTFILVGIAEGIAEMVLIHLGTHSYFGRQPLALQGFPVYLGFMNPACAMATTLVAAIWFDTVQGAKRFLLIPLTPPIMAGIYSAVTFPTIAFLHADAAIGMVIGSLMSILLALVLAQFVLRCLPRFARQDGSA